jgi:hypothetical protein
LTASPPKSYELRLRGWKAAEQPGVDLLDRDTLFDLITGDRDLSRFEGLKIINPFSNP